MLAAASAAMAAGDLAGAQQRLQAARGVFEQAEAPAELFEELAQMLSEMSEAQERQRKTATAGSGHQCPETATAGSGHVSTSGHAGTSGKQPEADTQAPQTPLRRSCGQPGWVPNEIASI